MAASSPHVASPLLSPSFLSQPAVTTCGGRVRSGAKLSSHVAALAEALRSEPLRVSDGDVVALCCATTDAALEAWLGVACAGALAAPLNPRWRVGRRISDTPF